LLFFSGKLLKPVPFEASQWQNHQNSFPLSFCPLKAACTRPKNGEVKNSRKRKGSKGLARAAFEIAASDFRGSDFELRI
jgi:hypothetical protein